MSVTDEVSSNVIITFILGIPIVFGIGILLIPFIFISCATGVDLDIVIKSLLVFGITIFLIKLLCKHQIIENGIVGLIVGSLIYKHFEWHPVFCILIGLSVIVILFLKAEYNISFWIKTIVFSLIVSFFVYAIFYSQSGLFPASDDIWRITFFIVFFLENLYIRFYTRHDQL